MKTMGEGILRDAQILWNYHHLSAAAADHGKDGRRGRSEEGAVGQRPFGKYPEWDIYREGDGPFERIIAFGSHDLRVARRAAALYRAGAAPEIVFTGGFGRITRDLWKMPEAEMFRGEAIRAGVPPSAILVETASSNTGENILFTRRLLEARRKRMEKKEKIPDPTESEGSALVVDKPTRERRTLATLRKQWPELNFRITSPPGSFRDTLRYYQAGAGGTGLSAEDFIGIMLGDLRRMTDYAEKGFQIPQPVPPAVRAAYHRLLNAGFREQ